MLAASSWLNGESGLVLYASLCQNLLACALGLGVARRIRHVHACGSEKQSTMKTSPHVSFGYGERRSKKMACGYTNSQTESSLTKIARLLR